jgi:hypothetical protein
LTEGPTHCAISTGSPSPQTTMTPFVPMTPMRGGTPWGNSGPVGWPTTLARTTTDIPVVTSGPRVGTAIALGARGSIGVAIGRCVGPPVSAALSLAIVSGPGIRARSVSVRSLLRWNVSLGTTTGWIGSPGSSGTLSGASVRPRTAQSITSRTTSGVSRSRSASTWTVSSVPPS